MHCNWFVVWCPGIGTGIADLCRRWLLVAGWKGNCSDATECFLTMAVLDSNKQTLNENFLLLAPFYDVTTMNRPSTYYVCMYACMHACMCSCGPKHTSVAKRGLRRLSMQLVGVGSYSSSTRVLYYNIAIQVLEYGKRTCVERLD